MLKIGSVRWKGKCSKHPGYAPEIDGRGGIRGGCRRCELLLDIYTHHTAMVRLMREFGVRPELRAGRRDPDDGQMSLLDWP
jgi:hypothetical protein